MTAYISVSVSKDRGRHTFKARASLIVEGETAFYHCAGCYPEAPNTVMWMALGPVNQEAKRLGLSGDINPEQLKPDVRVYRRAWRHDGHGWVMVGANEVAV